MRVLLLTVACTLVHALPSQTSAKDVYDQLTAMHKDPAKSTAVVLAAYDALEQHAAALAAGDGLHYRARIQQLAKEPWQDVVATMLAHVDAMPGTALANDSLVLAAQLVHGKGGDWARAQGLLERVKPDQLAEATKPTYDSLVVWTKSDGAQAALVGKPAPAFQALKVINGPAEFALSDMLGKVTVLDFGATWCIPCRTVVADLIRMQEQHGKDGLQVIGVTRFYGHGTDFADGPDKPRQVGYQGGRLSQDAELEINEHFAKAFKLNYPLVLTAAEVGKQYAIFAIPAVFVIDRRGTVTGVVTGLDHKKLDALVAKALAEPAPAEAGKGK